MSGTFIFEVMSSQKDATIKAGQLTNLGFAITGPTKFDMGSVSWEDGGGLTKLVTNNFGEAWIVFGTKP